MKAKIYVTLKRGVLDPQGKAIRASLSQLGIDGVEDVRVGKFMEVTLKEIGAEEARRRLDEACRRLLANTVIEEYRIEIGG
ncbi:MAG: phosphoribosylformylglycinamidine synthase [Deltaproteobacteria bacterium CG2_30_66_27]|nr:MAG: phosphoribosylformylglycinamidine synthase [Deltaproteobacteria bacterium CG2_30_66_27]PJB33115.1 MAG: phosphoribosylformylglycinamidine synthase [Deltaproteobacteria bacterium CG_4_9_14_3_um_filter_65_9]